MSDTLVLRYPLPDSTAECRWLRVDASAAVIGGPGEGTLADAAVAAEGARVALVLPGDDVLLLRAALPPRSGKRAAALVPFALEDQLAGEIETLHFALGPQADDGTVEAAIIERDLLQSRLAALASVGLVASMAYGAMQLTPSQPGSTTILFETPDVVLLREPDGSGSQVDLPLDRPVRELLRFDASAPTACTVYSTATIHAARLAALPADSGLPEGADYVGGAPQLLEYGALQKYADVIQRDPPINLLQGSFAPTARGADEWARWRVAALLLLGCSLLSSAVSTFDLVRAHRAEAKLDTQLHTVYAQALPGASLERLPAPRLVVESRVRRLMSAGHDGLIGALDRLGVAVSTTAGVTVKSINYHDGSMEALLAAGDLAALNQIQQDMGAQSRLAGVTTPDPQHAEGRLEISGLTP